MQKLLTLPNLLGVLRFVLALVLLALALQGEQSLFVICLVLAFILDAIDGPIARHQQQASAQGSRLDTVADFCVYTVLIVGVWQLWPRIFFTELVYIATASLSMLLPLVVALLKFQTFTSYHTLLVKCATVCIACSSVLLIMGGPALPFRIACIISAFAGLEQIVITLYLQRPSADVRHLFSVLKQRQQAENRP